MPGIDPRKLPRRWRIKLVRLMISGIRPFRDGERRIVTSEGSAGDKNLTICGSRTPTLYCWPGGNGGAQPMLSWSRRPAFRQ